MNKTFRVKIRLYNNHLVSRREANGMNAAAMCRDAGLSYPHYLNLEGLKESPICPSSGKWRAIADRLFDYYKCEPHELFPDEVFLVAASKVEKEFDLDEVVPFLSQSQERMMEGPSAIELRDAMQISMSTLAPREQDVLRMVYVEGLNYDEISCKYNVTPVRVGQIKEKALRKLRHSSRCSHLRPFLGKQERDLGDSNTDTKRSKDIVVTRTPDMRIKNGVLLCGPSPQQAILCYKMGRVEP